jgi:hypothetical protein
VVRVDSSGTVEVDVDHRSIDLPEIEAFGATYFDTSTPPAFGDADDEDLDNEGVMLLLGKFHEANAAKDVDPEACKVGGRKRQRKAEGVEPVVMHTEPLIVCTIRTPAKQDVATEAPTEEPPEVASKSNFGAAPIIGIIAALLVVCIVVVLVFQKRQNPEESDESLGRTVDKVENPLFDLNAVAIEIPTDATTGVEADSHAVTVMKAETTVQNDTGPIQKRKKKKKKKKKTTTTNMADGVDDAVDAKAGQKKANKAKAAVDTATGVEAAATKFNPLFEDPAAGVHDTNNPDGYLEVGSEVDAHSETEATAAAPNSAPAQTAGTTFGLNGLDATTTQTDETGFGDVAPEQATSLVANPVLVLEADEEAEATGFGDVAPDQATSLVANPVLALEADEEAEATGFDDAAQEQAVPEAGANAPTDAASAPPAAGLN